MHWFREITSKGSLVLPAQVNGKRATRGIQFPVLTTGARDSIPAVQKPDGTLIYNKTTHQFNYWNGSTWKIIATK